LSDSTASDLFERTHLVPMATQKTSAEVLALRITVVDPPPKIAWALQLGRDELVQPTASSGGRVSFEFQLEVVAGDSAGAFRLRGPAVQGRPGERFVYLCVGSYAGQVGAPASGRAKISLEGITRQLLDAVRARGSGVLEAEFAGTARDGGPARASVPLLGEGWRVA
jgi:hypothetical protein